MPVGDAVVRLIIFLTGLIVKTHVFTLSRLMGYRHYVPDKDSVLVTCCTNGLGHVHQMERILSVLEEAGMRFPVIALAKEQKVPAYKLESLKKRFPDATFYNLNLEIDYDNGKSFNNLNIIVSGTKMVLRRATPFYRKLTRILHRHRPAYCLSFWEPSVATFLNVMNCPTRLVAVASQGQIYEDSTGVERGLLMRMLRHFNVGNKGCLVPLSVRPLDSAIPQVVSVPAPAPLDTEGGGYFVAYSTVPQVLGAIGKRMQGHRVRLFVKEHRLAFYKAKFRRYPHIDVRETARDFGEQLARSRGLIASPSRGVVTQAIALGKPVYLFCPKGHLEQEYNLRFYMHRFAGVASPKGRRYRRYFGATRQGRGRNATVTMPEGHRGKMQTLLEWEASLAELQLDEQAQELREWLSRTDARIREKLMPLLSPTPEEIAAEAVAAAAEEEEEARERAESAAEAPSGEVDDEGDPEDDEEDDDDPEEDEYESNQTKSDGDGSGGDGNDGSDGTGSCSGEACSPKDEV